MITEYLKKGEELFQKNNFKDCLFYQEKIIELDKNNYTAWSIKGCYQSNLQENKKAIESLKTASKLKKDDPKVLTILGKV